METLKYSYSLHKINPQKDQYRFYAVRVTPSLFDDWTLIREWGRIGSSGTVRSDIFETEQEALQKMESILKDKQKRGYIVR